MAAENGVETAGYGTWMASTDWLDWHGRYDDPHTGLPERLTVVQGFIRDVLDRRPGRDIRIVSACAGQGRDLLPVLADQPGRERVRARLIELDPRNAESARAFARNADLDRVEVVTADASETNAYLGAVPADLVLTCGVFGNVSDEDVERTVRLLPGFCARRGARHLDPRATPAGPDPGDPSVVRRGRLRGAGVRIAGPRLVLRRDASADRRAGAAPVRSSAVHLPLAETIRLPPRVRARRGRPARVARSGRRSA